MRVLIIILLAIFSVIPFIASAQNPKPTSADLSKKKDTDTINYSPPARVQQGNSNQNVTLPRIMTAKEFDLSLYVLTFSTIVMVLEFVLILKKNIGTASIIKFMVVTLIIAGTLFIITAGYSASEISPALGLLGTIAGYLLGKSENATTDTNKVAAVEDLPASETKPKIQTSGGTTETET